MRGPHLLLLDLDNTLIDRAALFRGWAADFLVRHGLDGDDVSWLEEQDGDGLVPKQMFFERVRARYQMDIANESLRRDYYERYPSFAIRPPADTLASIQLLRKRGWRLGIVTNGPPMQEAVVDNAGLRGLFDTVCVSATVGLRKPDPAIFQLAAERCGMHASGNWMFGDSPTHDIAGAHASHMNTGWIARGRAWTLSTCQPTISAESVADAVHTMLELDSGR